MGRSILVTGPSRSGKSEWAEDLAIQSQKKVIYIATATQNPHDEEWQKRIEKHQQRRPEDWVTLNVATDLTTTLSEIEAQNLVLVDSLGTWVANLLEQDDLTWDQTSADLLEIVPQLETDLVFVAEETGWGIVPAYPLGRKFRDRLGNLTRRLGAICDTVYLVTGGYVLNLSDLGNPLPQQKS